MVVIAVLFGGALLAALDQTLRPTGRWAGAGVWPEVLAEPALLDAARFSVTATVVATAISALLAVPLGRLARDRLWGRVAVGMPILVPHLVVAAVAVVWLGPGGLAERLLGAMPVEVVRDRHGIGVVAVYVYKELPFLALLVASAWDPATTAREEAAAVLGASRWHRLRWIVWPAIRTRLTAGSLIVAAFILGAFEVPLVVGPTHPPALAVLAWQQTRLLDVAGHARASAVLLLTSALALVLGAGAAWIAGRRRE